MSIFEKRVAFKPYEYPDVLKFRDAINHSYWIVTEFNFSSDVQDFKTNLTEVERHAIRNALLAISQIEISVKKFWAKIGDKFPKSEFDQVGIVFAESEVRHAQAYSELLEILGLNDDFTGLLQEPSIQGRVEYLTKYLKNASDNSNENYTLTLTLFSIFIENVSLFSQFLIIQSFNKYKNILKDIDNVVQATQKEECYSEDTDILTPNGWVPLKDIKNGDSVYQFKNGKITKTTASNKIERDYNGRMYEIGNKSSNCLVTPGHEMVYINKMGDYEKNTAKDIKYHSKIKIPAGGILENNSEEKLTWSERLQIAMQSDATRLYWINANGEKIWRGKDGGYNYEFTLTKQRKKDRLRLILNNTNIEFVEQDIGKETEFKIKYNNDNDYKTFTWVDLSNKNKDWCIDFVQECVEWDGYRGGSNMGFSTTNKKVADIFHAISVLAGYRTNLLTNKSKRGYKDCYKISISERSLTPSGHSYDKVEQGYSGMVYCVTVPSGIIITRRNGKVCVAGNCLHALFGVYLIKEIQKECPDWFNEDFYNKLYRACKKAYEAEEKIIDWIFEKGELDFLPKDIVKEFIKDRFNESLLMVGGKEVFEVDTEKLSSLSWFNEGVSGQTSTDFFHKKPVTYSKKTKSIKAGDLF